MSRKTANSGPTGVTSVSKDGAFEAHQCEDGTWLAFPQDMPGFVNEGPTAEEAIEGCRKALEHARRNRP